MPDPIEEQTNILIVDDQPEYRLLLKDLLADHGFAVFTAQDGQDALQVMGRIEMDVIISDIYMPFMDGFRFLQTVRSMPRYEKLPFIFVSAYDNEYTLNTVIDPRYQTFLPKTSLIDEFLDWINYFSLPEDKRPKSPPNTETNFGLLEPKYLFLP